VPVALTRKLNEVPSGLMKALPSIKGSRGRENVAYGILSCNAVRSCRC
jgi:hypothetical protein